MKITKVSLSLIVALLVGCQMAPTEFGSGRRVDSPRGFIACGDQCVESQIASAAGDVDYQSVLDSTRSQHRFIHDNEQYGVGEKWTPSLVGDCEDFAMIVRDELRAMGVDASLVWAVNDRGINHVVTVTADGWVFDNRHKWIMRRDDLQYRWIKINHGNNWYAIR